MRLGARILAILALLAVSASPAGSSPPGTVPDRQLGPQLERFLSSTGKTAAVIEEAQRIAQAYEAHGDDRSAARALSRGVEAAAQGQDWPSVIDLGTRQALLCRAAADEHCEAVALMNLANADAGAGRTAIALGRLERAGSLFRRAGDYSAAVVARFNAAGARFDLGDADGALRELSSIESSLRPLGNNLAVNFDLSMSGIMIDAGNAAAALEAAQRADAEYKPDLLHADRYYSVASVRARSQALAGLALAMLGRPADSRTAFQSAFAAVGSASDTFETNMRFASALLAQHRASEAVVVVKRLDQLAANEGEVAKRDVHKLAARVYSAAGQPAQALHHETAAAELQGKFYRDSLAEAVIASGSSIALNERDSAAEQLRASNERQREKDGRALRHTRRLAFWALSILLFATATGFAVLRWRAGRARQAELARERARIAGEIHDTLLQGFIGVTMQVRAFALTAQAAGQPDLAGSLGRIARDASSSLAEARRAMLRIHTPQAMPTGSLATATAEWLTTLQLTDGVALTFDAAVDLPVINQDRTRELYYVVREAVTNALRHSHPSTVHVELRARGAQLEATVRDNGSGFDPALCAAARQDRWGLQLMRERMSRIGGLLSISAAPGGGTIVTARVRC